MPDERPWREPPPGWIAGVADRVVRLHAAGHGLQPEVRDRLFRFLRHLEVDAFPCPGVEVVSTSCVRLSWSNGLKVIRLTIGPRRTLIEASHLPGAGGPEPGANAVDAGRAAFAWYCQDPSPSQRRSKP